MHRATPSATSFRAFSAGGTRTCIHSIDDTKQMQEMGGNMMAGESRSGVESPQNYGFTSTVHKPDMGSDGSVTDCAEGFMSFMGGNRSFPVCGVMDDRRHRLNGCEEGDTAMYRGKDDNQQFHMTKDGGFWSADQSKTVRMQLVPSQQSSSGAQAQDSSGGSGGSGGSSSSGSQQKQKGQKPVYKQGQNSAYYVDVTSSKTTASGQEVHLKLSDKQTYVHCKSANVYLGGEMGSSSSSMDVEARGGGGNFLRVMLEDGTIAKNVWGLVGGGGGGGGGGSSGGVKSAAPPLQLKSGIMSLLHALPLSTDAVSGMMSVNVASPLMVDAGGNLTSAIKEAPTNSQAYGRVNAGWAPVAPLASPAFTGTPTAPTVATGTDSSTKIATTAFVQSAVAAAGGGLPEAPSDGHAYGRSNAAWLQVLKSTGDVVDGGNF